MVEQDSAEIENSEEKPEESTQDASVKNDVPKAPEIDLDEILKMVKESEKRIAETRASDLLRLEEKIQQLKTSSPQ